MKIIVVEGDSGTMVYCKGCGAIAEFRQNVLAGVHMIL